jgi:hypothetical protein
MNVQNRHFVGSTAKFARMSSDITRHLHGVAQGRLILAVYLRRAGDSSCLGLVWTNAPVVGFWAMRQFTIEAVPTKNPSYAFAT